MSGFIGSSLKKIQRGWIEIYNKNIIRRDENNRPIFSTSRKKIRKAWIGDSLGNPQLILFSSLLGIRNLKAQGLPEELDRPDSSGNAGGVALSYNGRIYVLGCRNWSRGSGSASNAKMYSYDPLNDEKWHEEPDIPYGFKGSNAVVCNDKIHIFGTIKNDPDDFMGSRGYLHYSFDGTSWVREIDNPYLIYDELAAVVTVKYDSRKDALIYVIGNDRESSHNCYSYNGVSWTEELSLGANTGHAEWTSELNGMAVHDAIYDYTSNRLYIYTSYNYLVNTSLFYVSIRGDGHTNSGDNWSSDSCSITFLDVYGSTKHVINNGIKSGWVFYHRRSVRDTSSTYELGVSAHGDLIGKQLDLPLIMTSSARIPMMVVHQDKFYAIFIDTFNKKYVFSADFNKNYTSPVLTWSNPFNQISQRIYDVIECDGELYGWFNWSYSNSYNPPTKLYYLVCKYNDQTDEWDDLPIADSSGTSFWTSNINLTIGPSKRSIIGFNGFIYYLMSKQSANAKTILKYNTSTNVWSEQTCVWPSQSLYVDSNTFFGISRKDNGNLLIFGGIYKESDPDFIYKVYDITAGIEITTIPTAYQSSIANNDSIVIKIGSKYHLFGTNTTTSYHYVYDINTNEWSSKPARKYISISLFEDSIYIIDVVGSQYAIYKYFDDVVGAGWTLIGYSETGDEDIYHSGDKLILQGVNDNLWLFTDTSIPKDNISEQYLLNTRSIFN